MISFCSQMTSSNVICSQNRWQWLAIGVPKKGCQIDASAQKKIPQIFIGNSWFENRPNRCGLLMFKATYSGDKVQLSIWHSKNVINMKIPGGWQMRMGIIVWIMLWKRILSHMTPHLFHIYFATFVSITPYLENQNSLKINNSVLIDSM